MYKLNFLVEDPGSINFILNLEKKLKKKKYQTKIFTNKSGKKYLELHSRLESNLFNKRQIKNLTDADFLILGTSEKNDSYMNDLVLNMKKKKKLCALIIDSPTFVKERLCKNINFDLINKINYFFVSDKNTSEKLKKLKVAKNKILEVFNPKFEYIQNMKKLPKKNQVLFLTELSEGLDSREFIKNKNYSFSGFSKSQKRTEIILEEFLMAMNKYRKRIKLGIKLHPKEKKLSYKKYMKYIDFLYDNSNSIKEVFRSKLIVGMSTNLLCETRLKNIATLSILPRKKEIQWINSDIVDYIDIALNKKQIQAYLEKFFNSKVDTKKISIKKQTFSECIIKIFEQNFI
jgi:hypothetical protein